MFFLLRSVLLVKSDNFKTEKLVSEISKLNEEVPLEKTTITPRSLTTDFLKSFIEKGKLITIESNY